ncbi:MAG TPA: pyridoxal-phosphate dependent enzyme [Gemmatimonadaceae bacterium]|nr:pyridoxal-phosphate dependent enzyme [Gemmatimonadaceae bacterium]
MNGSHATVSGATIPLVRRFPALASVPRAHLGRFPTPLQYVEPLAPGLWFKREDLAAEPLGGNKVRALEFLLGGVRPGDLVVTVGAAGSTHALATALYARRLGARVRVFRWPQELNDVARHVSERIALETGEVTMRGGVISSYLSAFVARLRGARWIAAGGSTPLGILGQVNAALELAEQVREGLMPRPDRLVVPLGTGGTAAGLALGLAIAPLNLEVIGVRVVPRVIANQAHLRRLIAATARLLERLTDGRVPRPGKSRIRILHGFYGGAYGRVTNAGDEVARECLEHTGLAIDPTYGAKALAAAVALSREQGGTTLFWLSFDARWMQRSEKGRASDAAGRE